MSKRKTKFDNSPVSVVRPNKKQKQEENNDNDDSPIRFVRVSKKPKCFCDYEDAAKDEKLLQRKKEIVKKRAVKVRAQNSTNIWLSRNAVLFGKEKNSDLGFEMVNVGASSSQVKKKEKKCRCHRMLKMKLTVCLRPLKLYSRP